MRNPRKVLAHLRQQVDKRRPKRSYSHRLLKDCSRPLQTCCFAVASHFRNLYRLTIIRSTTLSGTIYSSNMFLYLHYGIRERGIGSTSSQGNNPVFDNNKTEVLRLMLVLLSRQIYIPASALFTSPSLYSLYLVQKLPRRDVLTILCSLLNTAMNSTTTDVITIGTIAGKLPYNHLVFKGEDPRSTLITTCLQVLCVLLDFQSGTATDAVTEGHTSPSLKTNAFRYFIMKLVSKVEPLEPTLSYMPTLASLSRF